MFTRRFLTLAASATALAPSVLAHAVRAAEATAATATATAPRPYAIDDFYGPIQTYDTALSPNGKLISVAGLVKSDAAADKDFKKTRRGVIYTRGTDEKPVVLILDASDPTTVLKKFSSDTFSVEYTLWAKDDRLLIWIVVYALGVVPVRRIIAMQPDGSQSVVLFENQKSSLRNVFDLGQVIDTLANHPTDILMSAFDPNREAPALYRVNVFTGQADRVEIGTSETQLWATQDGVPMLRVDENDRGLVTVRARASGETDWKVVRKFRADQTPDFFIVGATEKPGVFLVGARLDGEDTVSVRELDLATMVFAAPRSTRAGHDATGGVIDQYKRFIATRYTADRTDYDFADPALKPHFRGIDSYFAHECNVRITDSDKDFDRFLLTVSGPRDPGSYYVYDRKRANLDRLGSKRPELDPDRLGATEALKVKTRDGATIDAYLTAPPDKKPGPLVVMPHGGPEVRDYMTFDLWVQVLAAQGWWVLQPNFRGSGGYGLEFAKAGWRRWDGRMQEDIDDAVDQAIALHKLDGRRVAVMGASYGGYAALMGALRRPDLYKGAISIAGPADLQEMLRFERSHDQSPDREYYGFWAARIGDPDKDRAAIEAASPRLRAKEFKVPVLLIHGSDDKVVPVSQSREMNRALKDAKRPVDYLEVKDVGHPYWPDAEEKTMLHRSVDFLAKAFV